MSKRARYSEVPMGNSRSFVATRKATYGKNWIRSNKKKWNKRTDYRKLMAKYAKEETKRWIEGLKEKKVAIETTGTTTVAWAATPTGSLIPITFNCVQGTDINDRIGNKVNLKKATLNFKITAGAGACNLLIMAAKNRQTQGFPGTLNTIEGSATSQEYQALLLGEDGQGTQPLTATSSTMIAPINTPKYYVPYREVFMMDNAYTQEGSTEYIVRSIDMTNWYKKVQTFADSDNTFTNENYSLLLIPYDVGALPAVTIYTIFEYTDA